MNLMVYNVKQLRDVLNCAFPCLCINTKEETYYRKALAAKLPHLQKKQDQKLIYLGKKHKAQRKYH